MEQKSAAKPCVQGSAQVDRSDLSKAPAHEAVNMDGRVKRLVESLDKLGEEGAAEVSTITEFFSDTEKCVWDEPTAREKTKKAAAAVKQQAGKLMAKQKIALRRYDTSSNSGQVAAEAAKEMLDSNMERLTNIQTFLSLLLMPQPSLDEFTDAMDTMASRGVRFTASLCKYAYWLKARSLMVFERYQEVCSMSTYVNASGDDQAGAPIVPHSDIQKLLDCDMPHKDVMGYASLVLQQCMSDRINELNEAHVGRPLCDYPEKKAALAMLEKVKKHCDVDGFAGADALPSIRSWITVLDLEHANPAWLAELVKDYANEPKDNISPTDILGQLLYTTKLGARLLDCAAAWAKEVATHWSDRDFDWTSVAG